MRIRTYASALAIIGALALAGAGEASTTPDSQGAICQAALEEVMATDQDVSSRYSIGSMHPIFLRGKGNRPDEWVIDYHRRIAVLEASFQQAAKDCPHFAPFTGQLPGHLLVSFRSAIPPDAP